MIPSLNELLNKDYRGEARELRLHLKVLAWINVVGAEASMGF